MTVAPLILLFLTAAASTSAQDASPGATETRNVIPTTLLTGGSSWQWPADAYRDQPPGASFLCGQSTHVRRLFAVRNREPPEELEYPLTLAQTGMQQVRQDRYCTVLPDRAVTLRPPEEQPAARTEDLAVARPTTFLLSWDWEELCEECPPSGYRKGRKCKQLELKPVCEVGFCETHEDLFWCRVESEGDGEGTGTGSRPFGRQEL